MRQVRSYVDERHAGYCVYCFGSPSTRDHVPPRVLLDKPYPENLPVVGSCASCNEGASLDEQYLACLLEVAVCGSADPDEVERAKVARILRTNVGLQRRLSGALHTDSGQLGVRCEPDRVIRELEKIARSLWAYECGEPPSVMEATCSFRPLIALDDEEHGAFFSTHDENVFPEVGSRLMTRVVEPLTGVATDLWQDVQTGRFAYAVIVSSQLSCVRMLIRGYLAAEVVFYH